MDIFSSVLSQFNINDAFNSFTSFMTEASPLDIQSSTFAPVDRIQRISDNVGPWSLATNTGLHTLSPGDALSRLRLQERRRKEQRRRMMASASSSSQSQDKADVVFFPTDNGGGDNGGCKDATTGGGGFNTFGFLAFLLAGFNAISVVSNNNNNRNNK